MINEREDMMKNRTSTAAIGESRLMDTEELRAYTNLGRNNAMKLGEEIGAKVQIGRRVIVGSCKDRSVFQFINRK